MPAPGSLAGVVGWRCRICGTAVGIGEPGPAVCPRSGPGRARHVLDLVSFQADLGFSDDPNPFLAYRTRLAVDEFCAANGMTPAARIALISETDALVAAVAGTGFRTTPFARNDGLSCALGFSAAGGVWVKDETGNVAGSHKARHLMSVLLQLRAAEMLGLGVDRSRPLAISSCGNAAIAASTLAAAVSWPIQVFVPPAAGEAVLARLTALDAQVIVCPRREDDPPGDPCFHRFSEAVAAGAIPFGVVGSANAWCLDGGRTIGWELADQAALAGVALDGVFVQVGGGALGTCLTSGWREVGGVPPILAVQTAGCAPLARAHGLAVERGLRPVDLGAHAAALMWPWETEPASLADGILDDETYDWIGLLGEVLATGGDVIVAPESDVVEADRLARTASGVPVSPTGASGLAGLITARSRFAADARLAVVFSGIRR